MEQLSQMLVGLSIEMSATMLAGVQVILLDPVRVTADNQVQVEVEAVPSSKDQLWNVLGIDNDSIVDDGSR